ncbi:unnamed protein product [Bemisia tabaci]|uniref:Uncharacterized protein n=1 Tax=Bemisia tabaci TaxID=7038 RepID=A0A9P0A0D2_BEMTA|nr:unnamed protein product [Bemisia tabaci]
MRKSLLRLARAICDVYVPQESVMTEILRKLASLHLFTDASYSQFGWMPSPLLTWRGTHSNTFFGNLVSATLCTCPYHTNSPVMITCTIVPSTPIISETRSFLICSLLEIPVDIRQKSISVALSISWVRTFNYHTSLSWFIIGLTTEF